MVLFWVKIDFIHNVLWVFPMWWKIPYINMNFGAFYNILLILIFIYFILSIIKNQKYYKNSFLKKYCVYLIWWLPWDWKTRLLSKFFKDIFDSWKTEIIKISNFYNWYIDLAFSSLDDFINLQRDIQSLMLYLNFNKNEKEEIETKFNGYFNLNEYQLKNKSKFEKIKNLLIQKGVNLSFVTWGDEFHNYLYARSAISNFSKDTWKKLLEMINQTRHSKQLLILCSQDTDALDLNLRQISDKEIQVKEYMWGVLYWFNLYKYLTQKYIWKDGLSFKKINKTPYLFFNWYIFYNFIIKINKILAKIQLYIFNKINKKFDKNYYKVKQIKNIFSSYKLDYNTNFNVDISIDIYKPWDLFKYLIKKFDK